LGLDFLLTRSFVLLRVLVWVLEPVLYGACAGEGPAVRGGLLIGCVSHLGAQVSVDAVVVRDARHVRVQPAAAAGLRARTGAWSGSTRRTGIYRSRSPTAGAAAARPGLATGSPECASAPRCSAATSRPDRAPTVASASPPGCRCPRRSGDHPGHPRRRPATRPGRIAQVDRATPDIDVAGEAGTGAEAVRLARDTGADVVIMDIRMPGMDGIEATQLINAAGTHPQVLVLTTFDEDDYVYGALRAGASGFLVKDMALEDILTAIRVVAAGDAMIAPGVTRRLIGQFADQHRSDRKARELTGITDREREVLRLVGLGISNAEIAATLFITAGTAKTHVAHLLAKLGARDRVQLVITAYQAGLSTPKAAPREPAVTPPCAALPGISQASCSQLPSRLAARRRPRA